MPGRLMHRLVLATAFSMAAVPASAQPDERVAVMAAVDGIFAAINSNDAAAFKRIMAPEGMIFSQRTQPDGSVKLRPKSNLQFISETEVEKRRFTEKYWNPTLLVHRDVAVFWAPYSFDIDGKRSHCGVDVFDLVKVDGQWKLANAMWTVGPDGCPKR